MSSQRFQDVKVWQKAHAWVLAIYKYTAGFPKDERYVLTSQLQRSAISVPANFVEGFRKAGLADKLRFYNISQGSLEESRYYLILAQDLGYGNSDALMDQIDEVSRMLFAYMDGVEKSRQ
jgi:four helix bundle protein